MSGLLLKYNNMRVKLYGDHYSIKYRKKSNIVKIMYISHENIIKYIPDYYFIIYLENCLGSASNMYNVLNDKVSFV